MNRVAVGGRRGAFFPGIFTGWDDEDGKMGLGGDGAEVGRGRDLDFGASHSHRVHPTTISTTHVPVPIARGNPPIPFPTMAQRLPPQFPIFAQLLPSLFPMLI